MPRSVFGGDLISGGSSSGSALAVATGEVPFAVATDTAGSGRVPPALNGIVGFKPSRGLISTVGLVPACRSLDCISLIAGTVPDLAAVFDVVAGVDDADPYTRARTRETAVTAEDFRVGLPDVDELEFFGDEPMRGAHLAARAADRAGLRPHRRRRRSGRSWPPANCCTRARGWRSGWPSSATSSPTTRTRCCR